MSSTNPVFVLPGALAERGSDDRARAVRLVRAGRGAVLHEAGHHRRAAGVRSPRRSWPRRPRCSRRRLRARCSVRRARPSIAAGIGELIAHGAAVLAGGQAVDGASLRVRQHAAARVRTMPSWRTRTSCRPRRSAREPRDRGRRRGADDRGGARARGQPHRHHLQRHRRRGRRRATHASSRCCAQRVGRLLNDKMPTGVAVSPAMNHGGPYPATGHPGFTAVGIPAVAAALRRAALLRQRPPAPAAAGARQPEPDRQHVALHRRTSGPRTMSHDELNALLGDGALSPARARRPADPRGGCRSRRRCCSRSRAATCSG